MKAMILMTAMILTLCNPAYAAMKWFNGSNAQLGVLSEAKCSTGVTCTVVGGKLNIVSSPTITTGGLSLVGAEAGNATLTMSADESDDNGDDWILSSLASGNSFTIGNDTSGSQVAKFTLTTAGKATFAGGVAVTGALNFGTVQTFTDSDATPDVSGFTYFNTNTSAVTITDFDGSGIVAGQMLIVTSKGAITYDVTSSGIKGGSTDIITAAGDVTTFIYDGTDWLVVARMDMSDDLN